MKAVMLEVPESLLAERRRTGADRWDEVWEGVLHMVPPPSYKHQAFGSELFLALAPLAKVRGLKPTYETGVFRPGWGEKDYRQPDLVFALASHVSERGIEGAAELVVEILSPGDETYEKLPFYSALGMREVLIVNPTTRAVELHVLREGRLEKATPDGEGALASGVLGVRFRTVDGPKLLVSWAEGAVEI
jgi:Uma2 family endonuclease